MTNILHTPLVFLTVFLIASVTGLNLSPDTMKEKKIQPPQDFFLKKAAEGTGILIGAAINYDYLKKDTAYIHLANQQYNLMAPEKSCMMANTAHGIDEPFDFEDCLNLINYGHSNNNTIEAPSMILGEHTNRNPPFVEKEKNETLLE